MALDFISILNPQVDKKKKKKFKIDFTQLVTLPEPLVEEPIVEEERPRPYPGLLNIAPQTEESIGFFDKIKNFLKRPLRPVDEKLENMSLIKRFKKDEPVFGKDFDPSLNEVEVKPGPRIETLAAMRRGEDITIKAEPTKPSISEASRQYINLKNILEKEGKRPTTATEKLQSAITTITDPRLETVLRDPSTTLLLGKSMLAAGISGVRGYRDASITRDSIGDKFIEGKEKDIQELSLQSPEIAGFIENLGYSLTAMIPSMAVALGAGVITRRPKIGAMAGAAVGGTMGYRMSSHIIAMEYLKMKNEEQLQATGKGITLEQEKQLKDEFHTQAMKYGFAEAVPEAIGGYIGFNALGKVFEDMFSKQVAGKLLSRLGVVLGEEITTETATTMMQQEIEYNAKLPNGKDVDWNSREDWIAAFAAVAPQTIALTLFTGGTVSMATKINSLRMELGNKNSDLFNNFVIKIEELSQQASQSETPISTPSETDGVEPVKAVEPVKGEKPTIDFTEMVGQTEKTMETDQLISHEGAPDKKRVEEYKKKIQAGKAIEPLKIIKEDDKFGIEDGKHRFEAYKQLEYTKVPVEDVTREFEAKQTEKAYQFYSPNIEENLTFEEAEKRLTSNNQASYKKIGEDIDRQLGINSVAKNAMAVWSDGAENTIYNVIESPKNFEEIRYSAALKGKIGNQKAVIPFMENANGKDSLYIAIIEKLTNKKIDAILSKGGFEFKTIAKTRDGFIVSVFDEGTKSLDNLKQLNKKYGFKFKQIKGQGEFLGSWGTRAEGLRKYIKVIKEYERGGGRRYNGQGRRGIRFPDDVLKPAKTEKVSDAGFVVPKKPKRKLSESKQGISSGSYYASKGDFAKMDIPKHVTHIEMPELIKLTKSLLDGAVPFIKKYPSAWGMFYADPLNPRIGINPSVFENLKDPTIAVKVLSHEIGHLIDYLPDANIKRGNLLNRLESLVKVRAGIFGDEAIIKQRRNLMNSINQLNRLEKTRTLTVDEIARRNKKINLFNEINGKLVFEKDMSDELKALTQFWKPFNPKANSKYTAYRYASPELYADFISVLFNRPDLAKIKAPKFHKRFFDFMEKKPSVKENYFKLMDFLTGKREDILDAREADIRKSFQTATELEIQKMSEGIGKTAKERASSLAHAMNKALVEKNIDLIQAVEKTITEGKNISPSQDPAVLLEELDLIKNEISNVFDEVEKIDSKLLDNKLKDEDFSLYLFYKRITGDRATKANPFGATKESSQEGLDRMKEKLGKEKFSVLEQSAIDFNEIYQKEMEQGVKDGLYSQELFDELTEGDNIYATFRVLDYVLSGSVTPNMIKQIGTFKDIGQTYQATISKMVAIRVAANKNNFKKVSGEFFLNTFSQDETIKADIPEIKKADMLKAKIDPRTGGAPKFKANKAGNILELITWRSEGKVKGVYVDPEIAKSFKYDTQMNTQFIRETVGLVNNEVFRKAYIDYSLRFLVRNPIRDLSQAWRALSMTDLQGTGAFKMTFRQFVVGIRKAYPEARMFAKNVKTETIQQILDKKILGVDEDYKMIKEDMDESTALSREMRKRGLRLKQIQKDKISLNPFVHLGNLMMQIGKTSEAITKIMAYQVIEEQLNMRKTTMDKRTAKFIRNNIGTPNWRKGGTITPTTNVLAMFSNVQMQGYKRTWGKKGVMVDPKTRSGYMWRTAQINIIPKLMMFMGAAGLLGDEIKKLYDRVSTYKMRNYLVIPLGSYNDKTVSITLPMDYDARLITAIMWTVLKSIEEKEVNGAALWNLLFAEMPSLTNTLNIPFTWAEYWRGINPRDNWRGRDVLTDQEFKAGGFYSLKPMLKWSWNQVMGGIFKVNVRDSVRQQTWLEKIARIGGINAFLDVGDYGLQEKIRKLQEPLEKEQAENLIEKNKNIIDHLRKFYKSDDSEKQIDKYITMAMREQFKGKTFTTAEEGNFRKSFMREAVKSYNNAYMTALIYSNTINEQKVAIKEIKKSADKDTFYKIQALFLNSKLISIKTWEAALNEFIKEKEEK